MVVEMNDDIETLRRAIDLGTFTGNAAIAALERLVVDHDSLRKALDYRYAADKKAWSAIMRATGKERGLPDNKEVIAFYVAEVERLEKELTGAREAIKTQNGIVISSVEKTIEARKKLPCGHHASSLVKSVESDAQFCEVCDLMSQRDDAVAMEETYRVERDDWKSRAQQFQRERAELADKLNGTPCAEIRWQYEHASLRAKLEKAAEAIKLLLATPEIAECDPRDKDEETHVAERKGRAILSELSADAPAQPPQISDEVREAMVEAEKALELYACPEKAKDRLGAPICVPDFYNELDFGDVARASLAKLRSVK